MLDKPTVDELFGEVRSMDDYRLVIDLASQTVATPTGRVLAFDIEPGRKRCLLDGLDDIALTLQRETRIHEYEAGRRELEPWLFCDSLPGHVR